MDIIIALITTAFIFLAYNIVKITIGFYFYEKAKKIIIYTIYSYFQDINAEYVNLEILKQLIEKKMEATQLKKKIDFIRIKWMSKETFKLEFKLNIKKNFPVHSYSFNVNKIKRVFNLEGKRGVDFE